MLTRNPFFSKIILAAGFIQFFVCCTPPEPQHYNVLLIIADDLRPELGVYGNKTVLTPNLDKLGNTGLVFSAAFCQISWCSPSRTSLLTGLRPDQTRVYDLKTHFRSHLPAIQTLPQYFKNNGYFTAGFGKVYHNEPELQDSLSWSQQCWFPPSKDPIYEYVDSLNIGITLQRGKPFAFPTESADVPDDAYPDGKITKEVIRTLRETKDRPFFLAAGFYKPHLPYNAPSRYFELYDPHDLMLPPALFPKGAPPFALREKSEEANYIGVGSRPYSDSLKRALMHGYYACTSYVDAQIGQILQELQTLGLDKNTIVVFWGDHGYKLGEYGHWSKHSNFEVDTRVPLLIRFPGNKPKTRNEIVETLDLYPTLCALAGLPVPDGLAGEVLSDRRNMSSKQRRFAISQIRRDTMMGYTIRTDNFRYTQWLGVKSQKTVAEELYDHGKDQGETVNVSATPAYERDKQHLNELLRPYLQYW